MALASQRDYGVIARTLRLLLGELEKTDSFKKIDLFKKKVE